MNESRCPHVLVSADAPNIINVVNDKFTHKFGCSHAQALGQPLAIIQADHRQAWRSLLAAAAAGRIARSNVSVRQPWFSPGRAGENATNNDSKESDVICVPVVDVPNGPISNILVLFAPSRPHADSEAAGCLSPAAAGDDGRVLSRAGPIIRPRRKILADGTVALPEAVTLTPELLDNVPGLPLRAAAAAVGVSPTAFKKACRKLGLRRWVYQRPPSKRGPHKVSRRFDYSADGQVAPDSEQPAKCSLTESLLTISDDSPGHPGTELQDGGLDLEFDSESGTDSDNSWAGAGPALCDGLDLSSWDGSSDAPVASGSDGGRGSSLAAQWFGLDSESPAAGAARGAATMAVERLGCEPGGDWPARDDHLPDSDCMPRRLLADSDRDGLIWLGNFGSGGPLCVGHGTSSSDALPACHDPSPDPSPIARSCPGHGLQLESVEPTTQDQRTGKDSDRAAPSSAHVPNHVHFSEPGGPVKASQERLFGFQSPAHPLALLGAVGAGQGGCAGEELVREMLGAPWGLQRW